MATTKRTSKKTAEATIDFALLKQIHDATMNASGNGMGFMYTSLTQNAALVAAGLVEVNNELTDDKGNVATRTTLKGKEEMEKQTATTETTTTNAPAAAPVASNGFKIVSNVPLPTSKRGSAGDKKYPFDALQVGQSFFVPATPDFDPIKKLGSTVSSATARYAVEIPGQTRTARNGEVVPATRQTRRFVMRKVADGEAYGHPGVAGAGIFRIEDAPAA